jgi:hypothetical protein
LHWRHSAAGIVDTSRKFAAGVTAINRNLGKDVTIGFVHSGSQVAAGGAVDTGSALELQKF